MRNHRQLVNLMANARDRRNQVALMLAAQDHAKAHGWYNIRLLNKADAKEAECFIYDVIGADFWGEGVAAGPFVKELRELDVETIHVRINSPGGSIFDALAIRQALEEHPATIWTHYDGIGASAATWVSPVDKNGKTIMAPKSRLFIHDPIGFIWGNAKQMRDEADLLDGLGDDIADFFVDKAGGTRREWRDQMLEEKWFSDQQAVAAGLADEISGKAPESNTFDPSVLAIFNSPTPADLFRPSPGTRQSNTDPDIETRRRLIAALDGG